RVRRCVAALRPRRDARIGGILGAPARTRPGGERPGGGIRRRSLHPLLVRRGSRGDREGDASVRGVRRRPMTPAAVGRSLHRVLWAAAAFAAATARPLGAANLVVTSDADVVNGDTSGPAALLANPGPDGISLREAL